MALSTERGQRGQGAAAHDRARGRLRELGVAVALLVAGGLGLWAWWLGSGSPGTHTTASEPPLPVSQHVEGEVSWPGPANTGVRAGTSLTESGSITVTTDGAVIEAMDVHGTITVKAKNVTIRQTRVTNNPGSEAWTVRLYSDYSGLVIEDSELDGGGSASIAVCCGDFTLRRVDIHGSIDGVRAGSNVRVDDSYIHDLARTDGSHNDTIQTLGGSNITIRHNTLLAYDAESGDPMNAAYIISPTGTVREVSIVDNYMDGGNYTLYLGENKEYPVIDVTVRGNTFSYHHRYGPVAHMGEGVNWDYGTNVYVNTGEPVLGDGGP